MVFAARTAHETAARLEASWAARWGSTFISISPSAAGPSEGSEAIVCTIAQRLWNQAAIIASILPSRLKPKPPELTLG